MAKTLNIKVTLFSSYSGDGHDLMRLFKSALTPMPNVERTDIWFDHGTSTLETHRFTTKEAIFLMESVRSDLESNCTHYDDIAVAKSCLKKLEKRK